ncbi:hypothetical protein BD779DRAFT_565869 [Infundibulicybe gibba]|nr:hypothetical protein BD779DRAFT_565869 [Infundibulicybe gibba]
MDFIWVSFFTFGAFVLHVFATFSMPMISSFYFLYSSQAGGVRFGLWGWCLDEGAVCINPLQLGFTWEPQIAFPVTKACNPYFPCAAFVFAIAIWNTAKLRFQRAGFDAQFGPLIWMSLAATIALLIVSVSSSYTALEFRKEMLRREARRKARRRTRRSGRRHHR